MRATPEAMPAGKRVDESHAGGDACGEGRWWLTQPHMQWKETKTKKKGIMEKKTVVIIHFNTPELTEAAIRSLRKHDGEDYEVVVFDNSTDVDFPAIEGMPSRKMKARPFVVPRGKAREVLGDVKVINNRKGKVIDFQKLLAEYPDKNPRHSACNDWGSTKHIWTVQKLWELVPEGFVLMESDILLKKPIDGFFDEKYSVVGYWQKAQPANRFGIGRMLPMLCWMNVPMLTKEGARYFDPERSWMLWPGEDDKRNWYDTGACLLDDILKKRPRLKGLHVDIRDYVVHLGSGSWKTKDVKAWLEFHKDLWQ